MTEYTNAAEVQEIAETVAIPKWHPDLTGAAMVICLPMNRPEGR